MRGRGRHHEVVVRVHVVVRVVRHVLVRLGDRLALVLLTFLVALFLVRGLRLREFFLFVLGLNACGHLLVKLKG